MITKVSRIKSLDAARGIAALIVVVYHCLLAIPVPPALDFTQTPEFRTLWRKFFLPGDFAVTAFFVISGASFGVAYKDLSKFNAVVFFIRRFFRIYPVYLLAMLTGFVTGLIYLKFGGPGIADAKDWLHAHFVRRPDAGVWFLYLTLSFNWFLDKAYFINVLWTLPIEAQFYLFVPVFVFLLSRGGILKGSTAVLLFCGCLYVFSKKLHLHAAPFERLWEFGGGFLLGHYLIHDYPRPGWVENLPRFLLPPVYYLSRLSLPTAWFPSNVFSVIAAFCVIHICLRHRSWGGERRHDLWIHLGERSYSLYLFHLPVIAFFTAVLNEFLPPAPGVAFFVSLTLLVVPSTNWICGYIYRFEFFFINLGRRTATFVQGGR